MTSPTGGRLRREIADLNPGYGAWVMATAIVSTGFDLFGLRALSEALLWVAAAAFALLLVAYTWRLLAHRRRMLADARDPSRAFGYFSLVAATNVLGVRLGLDDHLTVALALGAASVPLWLLLTYAIPGAMIVGRRQNPVLPGVNGSWFLWVVATQSLSVTASTLGASMPGLVPWLAPPAVALWGIGTVLYLMLAGLVMVRLLESPVTPQALSPTYWIYMGATAITVLAAARILRLPPSVPVVAATRDVVSGLAFLLWAFGTWWIPLLLAFGVWRHGVHREPLRYEATWWSVVFPLGMYAAASAIYGWSTGMTFMVDIARGEVWLGLAAWLGVLAAMVISLLPDRTTPIKSEVRDEP
jgi:tellurite resistance protein TehA-like permease